MLTPVASLGGTIPHLFPLDSPTPPPAGMFRLSATGLCLLQLDLAMDRLVSNRGTAVVVDGARLLVTPLQRALVPPPMCAAAADLPAPVQCCAFGQHNGNEVGPPLPT